jgi:hypothetical protein
VVAVSNTVRNPRAVMIHLQNTTEDEIRPNLTENSHAELFAVMSSRRFELFTDGTPTRFERTCNASYFLDVVLSFHEQVDLRWRKLWRFLVGEEKQNDMSYPSCRDTSWVCRDGKVVAITTKTNHGVEVQHVDEAGNSSPPFPG